MLPDYPQTKRLLAEMFHMRIDAAQNSELGTFAEIATSRLFEGSRTLIQRTDGSSDEAEMEKMEVSAGISHDIREIESLSLEKIFEILDETGTKMASERMKLLLSVTDRVTQEVGNVGNANTPEGFLDLFAKAHHDFDENGELTGRQVFVTSAEGKKRLQQIFREIDANPSLKKRYDQIMALKLQDFRDREAARKLVD